MPLRAKLLLWYTGVFGVSGCVLVLVYHSLTAHKMRGEADRFLEDEYEECVRITREYLDEPQELVETIRREIGSERYFPLMYRLHDTEAHRDILLFIEHDEDRDDLARAAPILSTPPGRTYSLVWLDEERRPLRLLTGPLDPASHPNMVVQVGMHTPRLQKHLSSLRTYLFLILAAIVIVAALGGWLLASRSLRPIDEIVGELEQIESRTLDDRLEVGSAADEVTRLRQGINRMLERLHFAFDRLQRFTADAAHELRTPVSALQCRLEVAIDRPGLDKSTREVLGDVFEQAAELAGLLENLLLLARMDANPGLSTVAAVDLSALLCELREPFALLADDKGVSLSVDVDGAGECQGDMVFLRQLFANLIDNAVRYTPSGGTVAVRAEANADGWLVTVSDTGIGMEPGTLAHVFDRFYRADDSRSRADGGAGIGLSIVKRAVELHHGEITVQSTLGEGTAAHVWLPRRCIAEAANEQ